MSQPITQEQALAQSFAPEESLSLAPIAAPVKPKRRSLRKSEKKFIGALTIRAESGMQFRVPINEESAKAERQLLAAKLMKAYSQNVDFMLSSNLVLEPKSLADFMKAGALVSEMVEAAHKGTEAPETPVGHSAIGTLAGQMLGAAAKGLMEGAGMSLEDRMRKISELGKKQAVKVEQSNDRIRAQAAKAEVIVEPEQTTQ